MRDDCTELAALREHWATLADCVRRRAGHVFGHRTWGEDCEELTQEAECLAWQSALRLIKRGARPWEWPWGFARTVVRAVSGGARFTPHKRAQSPFRLTSRDGGPVRHGPDFLATLGTAPGEDPAAQVAVKLDMSAWLDSLPPRLRELAGALAAGGTTGEVAAARGTSLSAVSNARRELERSWKSFCGAEVI